MKPVYVLGNGQLGRMLRQAGEPMGIKVYPIGLDANPEQLPHKESVITAEIERWPETELTRQLATNKAFFNRTVFPLLADRKTQKELLDGLRLSTSPWQLLKNATQWPQLFAQFGNVAIVKRCVGGYDGRGQWRLTSGGQNVLPPDVYGECIVEQDIHFSAEVSLIGARNRKGQMVFYPLTDNVHENGILRVSILQPQAKAKWQHQAESMLSAIMEELKYVGVMAMECFIENDKLLINELSPRVHNSGHWTQNGASISQFELHLRAILDLPLPTPVVSGQSVMINLIGTPVNIEWLTLPLLHLHWYEKDIQPGRKVGHLNLYAPSTQQLHTTLTALVLLLPNEYQSGLKMIHKKLSFL